jgi:septal ring factor EnvC (AmiA/AmiB activator)
MADTQRCLLVVAGPHRIINSSSPAHAFSMLQILVVVALLMPAMTWCAEPAKIDVETGKLLELRTSIAALKKELDAVRGEHDTQQQILEKTDKAIGAIRKEMRRLERDADAADSRLAELERQRGAAHARLAGVRSILERELRAAWMGGRQQRIKLLLNQEDPASIGRMLAYQGYFARARVQRMEVYNASLQALQDAGQEVRDQQARIALLQQQQQQQAALLADEQETQGKLVDSLQQKLQSGNSQLVQLQQDEQRVNQLVQSLQQAMRDIPSVPGSSKSLHQLKGQLHWPVSGRVSMSYGARQASGQMTSRGVHISAPAGAEVRAVARGRIAFADWLRGFGLLIIIDHGSGYMTLYGENSSLFKAVGEWVEQGEVVSATGNSGGQPRTGVYLELRKNGQPVNPASWFKGQPSAQQAGRQ